MFIEQFEKAVLQLKTSGNGFLEAVLRERPDLVNEPICFPGQGTASHTVFIGNEVFKGPAWKILTPRFNKEIALLQELGEKDLPVPKITYIGQESVFYGMTRLPGVRMKELMQELTQEEKRGIAKDLVDFIIKMALAVPPANGRYIRHDDLHPGNILLDPETRKISGIIDMACVGYHAKPALGNLGIVPALFYQRTQLNGLIREEYEARKKDLPDLVLPYGGSGPRVQLRGYL